MAIVAKELTQKYQLFMKADVTGAYIANTKIKILTALSLNLSDQKLKKLRPKPENVGLR